MHSLFPENTQTAFWSKLENPVFFLNFAPNLLLFCILSAFQHKKHYPQCFGCAAAKCWSKYTTCKSTILLKMLVDHIFLKIPLEVILRALILILNKNLTDSIVLNTGICSELVYMVVNRLLAILYYPIGLKQYLLVTQFPQI